MEQIIEALPELIPFTNKKDGIVYYSGLCIKYSTGNSCWVAGYGGGINPGKKRAFCGATPKEALIKLYRDMITNENHKKSVVKVNFIRN